MLSKGYEFELKPFDNDVPESWNLVPLEKTGDVVYGIQASVANNLKPVGIKILTNKNITLNGQIDLEKINYFELSTDRHFKTILKKGDLLFNWRSGSKEHVGKTAFFDLDGEYTHSSFILRIRTNQRVERWFLYFYLNYLRLSNYFLKLQTYAINAKFNKSALNRLPVILPPLDEQKKIAYVLSTVQRAIAQQEQIIQTTTELKKALMHKLFTEGLHGEKQKETAIGLVPESWKISKLQDLCLKVVDCPHSTPKFQPTGVRCIKNVNLRNGLFADQPAFFTSEEDYIERTRRCEPQENDVLFSREAPVGESCLVPKNLRMSLGQRMMLIRTDSKYLDSYFLVQLFYSPLLKLEMKALEKGATAKHLNVADVKNLKILVPPIKEQLEISNLLSLLDSKLVNSTKKKQNLQDLFRTLLHQLMTAQIRVHDIDLPGFEESVLAASSPLA